MGRRLAQLQSKRCELVQLGLDIAHLVGERVVLGKAGGGGFGLFIEASAKEKVSSEDVGGLEALGIPLGVLLLAAIG